MKKAYVKTKGVKKPTNRLLIISAVLSAVLCAGVFSFFLKPDEKIPQMPEVDITEVTPEEIAQVSDPIEIEVPVAPETKQDKKEEATLPKPQEIPQPEETQVFNSNNIRFLMPVKGEITNDYSGSKPQKSKTTGEWRVHSGIDIKAPKGTDVFAPAEGVVTFAQYNKVTGNTVTIDHGNGFISTLYNLDNINTTENEKIKEGAVIGTVGNSAPIEAADEPHLHFELKKDGKTVNPKDYMK